MFTSLSTSTGTANARCTWPGTSYRSHPRHDRRIDRATGGVLDRTGQADPDRGQLGDCHDVGRRAARATHLLDPSEHVLGPGRHVESLRCSARIVPARSARHAVAWLAPMSTPATTRARGSARAATAAGRRSRPRRRTAPPSRAAQPSMRAAIVERAIPRRRRAGPGAGRPVPNSSKTSLVRTIGSEPRDFVTSSKQLLPNPRQKYVTPATVLRAGPSPPLEQQPLLRVPGDSPRASSATRCSTT